MGTPFCGPDFIWLLNSAFVLCSHSYVFMRKIWKEFQGVLEAQTLPPYILVSEKINNQEISFSNQLRFFYFMLA